MVMIFQWIERRGLMEAVAFDLRDTRRFKAIECLYFRVKPTWPPCLVDVRLPGKESSTSHGARPIHLIITMIKWIRTSMLSIKNSLMILRLSSSSGSSGEI